MSLSAIIGGSLLGGLGGILGGKKRVKVPEFKPLDLRREQEAAFADTMSILPQAQEVARQTTESDISNIQRSLESIIPGYASLFQSQARIAEAGMRGELDEAVRSQIARSAAERSLQLGIGGSQAARNLEARDLGLTALNLQQQGFAQASQLLGQAATIATPAVNRTASMFLTPAQRLNLRAQENTAQFNQQMAAAQAAAQPGRLGSALGGVLGSVGGITAGYGLASQFGSMFGGIGSTPPAGTTMGIGAGGGQSFAPNSAFSISPFTTKFQIP